MLNYKRRSALMIATGLLALPSSALAQEPAAEHAGPADSLTSSDDLHQDGDSPTSPTASESRDSGDIIVTAQRRSERLQKVPISLSALDEGAIKATGISEIGQIAHRTPGVSMGTFGVTRPLLYIRGIGTRNFDPGSEASVGIFVDDVFVGRQSGTNSTSLDVARIEVLKGPQGTLYGRNTIAGALNIVTADPTPEFLARVSAGIGNYEGRDASATLSGPIAGQKLMGRLFVYGTRRDGYLKDLQSGFDQLGYKRWGGRLKLLSELTDRLTVRFTGEISRDSGDAGLGRNELPAVLFAAPGRVPAITSDPLTTRYSDPSNLDRKIDVFALRADYEFDGATLSSITAYRHSRYFDTRDFDSSELQVTFETDREVDRQFTQEIRLTSNDAGPLSLGGRLQWVAGLFYFHNKALFDIRTFYNSPDANPVFRTGAPQRDTDASFYRGESYAAFGQFTYAVTEALKVTLGGRYTRDRKGEDVIATSTDTFPIVPAGFTVTRLKRSWSSFDPRAVIFYDWSSDVMTYASWSRGFKSGAFQVRPTVADQARVIANPEHVTAYEMGFKSQFFNRSLTVNLAAFRNDYSELQLSRIVNLPNGSVAAALNNVGQSRIKGFELEVGIRPSRGFELSANYAYTDAIYRSYNTGTIDFSGTRMVRAPKHSFNLGGQHRVDLDDETSATLRLDYDYRSVFFHEPGQGEARFDPLLPRTREPAYGLANARLTMQHGALELAGFMRNVFDTRYRAAILKLGTTQIVAFPGEPRTYGISATYTFQ